MTGQGSGRCRDRDNATTGARRRDDATRRDSGHGQRRCRGRDYAATGTTRRDNATRRDDATRCDATTDRDNAVVALSSRDAGRRAVTVSLAADVHVTVSLDVTVSHVTVSRCPMSRCHGVPCHACHGVPGCHGVPCHGVTVSHVMHVTASLAADVHSAASGLLVLAKKLVKIGVSNLGLVIVELRCA
jgi:hypothetical protein